MTFRERLLDSYHNPSSRARKIYTALLLILPVAAVGAYLQFSSHAATPTASLEAEAGTKTTQAVSVSDTTASGAAALRFTQSTPVADEMLMCVNDSPNDHGGTDDWDAWRTYRKSSMLGRANLTGNLRPKIIAYSEDGPNLGGASPNYNTVYSHVLDELNSFYYTTATGQTHSARWGIKLFWSNGNENFDKGALSTPHTTAKINAYTTSQRALYDAVHYVDSSTGQRRFPDAYAGSNPTTYAEQQGLVEDWLHASAQYHDFVMWSMYPPGRSNTAADPTFNWPTYNESQRNATEGFLLRTFYRTKQAEALAGHPLLIGMGEVGIGNDPDDGTTRPYYAVYGLAHALARLSKQYTLTVPFACWWDQQVDASSPQNILSDEQSGLNPTTRQAWQNWKQYDTFNGGTRPTSWASNPKSGWKTTGSAPTQ